MRDLFLLAILPFMLYAMAKRPFIALGMWLWTALFFPNGWVYGLASNIRYNLLFTAIAILGYVVMKKKPKFPFSFLAILVFAFFVWTTFSTILGIGRVDVQWDIWSRFAKIVILFLFVLLIVEKKLHADFMLWCVVLSVGFYANLEALKFITTGGGHKIAGMTGHVLGDRNELSLAFVMTLPICFYLLREYGASSRIIRAGLLATISLLVIGVVGTQSRGGFIALLALGGYLFIKSDRKILMSILIVVLGIAVAHLATNDWLNRINTIESAGEDGSFMTRVVSWKLSFIMAARHPFLGGGFKSLEYLPNWVDLARDFYSFPWFYTGELYPTLDYARAAHSIYFQVLGEHGFVGFALYVAILVGAFHKAGKIARAARKQRLPDWFPTLATMLQLSIFTFALGGAALSFAYFDLIFAIIGLVIVLEVRILPALSASTQTLATSPQPPREAIRTVTK